MTKLTFLDDCPLVLYANGVHDDTLTLNALFYGHPTVYLDGTEITIRLRDKQFLISATLQVPKKCELVFTNNFFVRAKNFTEWAMKFESDQHISFSENRIF